MRNRLPVVAAIVLCLVVAGEIRARGPGEIEGLVAWFTADSLNDALGAGSEVKTWTDLSGKGRDLTYDERGLAALYLESQINGRAAVRVRKGATYSMAQPLELSAHTIVLVHRAAANSRALFRGSGMHGLLLHGRGNQHHYQNGSPEPGQQKRYCEPGDLPAAYAVTVLGRDDSGKLHAFVNGADVSAGTRFVDPIRIAKFFDLRHSTHSRSDGNGLFIADLAIFDRYLTDEERADVTEHMTRHYGLAAQAAAGGELAAGEPAAGSAPAAGEVAAEKPAPRVPRITAGGPSAVAQLRTTDQDNLNVNPGLPIRWTIQDVVDEPFRHDPEGSSERLHCTRDGTRVRLYASLPLWSTTAGPTVQLMVLKNGKQYLPVESWSAPFVPAASAQKPDETLYRSMVSIEVLTQLDAGDYVEVLTWKVAADGPVVLDARKAVLIAEVK